MKTGLNIRTIEARAAILDAIDQDMAIAELEPLGLSMRTISGLESKLGVIYLKELLGKTLKELKAVRNLGARAVREIETALNDLPLLTENHKKAFGLQVVPLLGRAKQMRTHKAPSLEPKYDYQGRLIE